MSEICYGCFKEYAETEHQCPYCGHNSKTDRDKYPLALPNGALLAGHYRVGKVLGQGGFGITYLAQEYKTKELVAIKEYFPDSMATRNQTLTVRVVSGDKRDNFEYGKTLFLQEAKTLAVLKNNEHVVKIYEYFEENGTAYFSMEYVSGIDFGGYIKERGGRISFDEAMKIAVPVMDALSAMHSKGLVHRDVTPDNIRISDDGAVKLLDFGAARYSVGDVTKSLEVVLKHGFAPVEQYSRHGKQGPFTDVYALCATIYYAITGKRPFDSVDRMDEDLLALPSALGAEISYAQEEALMRGLAVRATDRFQTVNDLRAALEVKPDDRTEKYKRAAEKIELKTLPGYTEARAILQEISDYKDASALISLCESEIQKLKKKRTMRLGLAGGVAVVAALALVLGLGGGRKQQKEEVVAHVPGEPVIENMVEATCSTAGSYEMVVYCSECGEEMSREKVKVAALGHKYGEWTEVKAATETENGEEMRVCENDSTHVQTRVIPKLQHSHTLSVVAGVAPTCETDGNIEYYVCSGCGGLFRDQAGNEMINEEDTILPMTGHAWGEWTVSEAATEEQEGLEIRFCLNDQTHTETRTVAKLPHNLTKMEGKAATCEDVGNIEYYVCSNCGKLFRDPEATQEVDFVELVIPVKGHDWGEWEITLEPTETETGEKIRVCKNDPSHRQSEEVPMLEPDPQALRDNLRALLFEVEQGNIEAMKQLGDCYMEGLGIEINYNEALYWYFRAIEGGNVEAMNKVASCFENGLGIEQNMYMADYWSRKASNG